jgi:SAM-dependent methyltransferase
MTSQRSLASATDVDKTPLRMEEASCCLCGPSEETPIAVGIDFEYQVTEDAFLMSQCRTCGLVFLKHRPVEAELPRIYPPTYHAFDFSPGRFGLAYRIRRRLEARRLLAYGEGLPSDAHILDVGCGDGFHLKLLRDFGAPTWSLDGVDTSPRAVEAACSAGLNVQCSSIQAFSGHPGGYDLALLIATIEHVPEPLQVLRAVADRLRPGGRVVIVTDNAASWSFRLFHRRFWGGYHWPRHWYLFTPSTLTSLGQRAGLEVERVAPMLSPVNWVYSVHNALADARAPAVLIRRFTLASPVSLGCFTLLGMVQQALGQGELLHAVFRRPP